MGRARAAILTICGLFSTTAQAADGKPCDYFANALIGTRCAQTISVGAAISYSHFNDHLSSADAYSSSIIDSEISTLASSAFVSVTPLHWLTLAVSASHINEEFKFDATNTWTGGFGPPSTAKWSGTVERSYYGAQTLSADVNVLDTGGTGSRYVVNGFVGGSYTPDQGAVTSKHDVFGGLAAHARWQLGQSDFGLNATAAVSVIQFTGKNNDGQGNDVQFQNVVVHPSFRLLVSYDPLGLAVGPTVSSAHWISSNGVIDGQTDAYRIGGQLVWQPFRSSTLASLKGLVIEASARQSIGTASLGTPLNSASDQTTVSGSATFNFRY
jgi:hypothetical protein